MYKYRVVLLKDICQGCLLKLLMPLLGNYFFWFFSIAWTFALKKSQRFLVSKVLTGGAPRPWQTWGRTLLCVALGRIWLHTHELGWSQRLLSTVCIGRSWKPIWNLKTMFADVCTLPERPAKLLITQGAFPAKLSFLGFHCIVLQCVLTTDQLRTYVLVVAVVVVVVAVVVLVVLVPVLVLVLALVLVVVVVVVLLLLSALV